MLLYTPAVQQAILKIAVNSVNSTEGTELTVDKFSLRPPFKLSIGGVQYIQQGDTVARVGSANLDVAILPLITGEVKVNLFKLDDTYLNIGHPDSSSYLNADLKHAEIQRATIGLSSKKITIKQIDLAHSDILMQSNPVDTIEETDTTTVSSPLPWKIYIDNINASELTYSMSVAGSIDTLGVTLPSASIHSLAMNMTTKKVDINSAAFDSVAVAYIIPPTLPETETPADSPDDSDTVDDDEEDDDYIPWCVNIGKINITGTDALYGTSGVTPHPGLDMNHLRLSDIKIDVDSLLSCGSTLRLPIRNISARESCGLEIALTGTYAMDSDSIAARDIDITTRYSHLALNASIGLVDSGLPTPVNIIGKGYISPRDVEMAIPSMKKTLAGVPADDLLDVDINIGGRGNVYDINTIALQLPKCFKIDAYGSVADPSNIDRMEGGLKLTGRIYNNRFLNPTLKESALSVPPLRLNGDVKMHAGRIDGFIDAVSSAGRLALDADWHANIDGYDVTLKTDSFPIESFLPGLELERITTDIALKGRGYDLFSPTTAVSLVANLDEITYLNKIYQAIKLSARLDKGQAEIIASSPNPDTRLDFKATGNLSGKTYNWNLAANIANLDLEKMGMSDSVMHGNMAFTGDIAYTPAVKRKNRQSIDGHFDIASLDWTMNADHFATTALNIGLSANDSLTTASIDNHDLHSTLSFPMPLDSVMAHLATTSVVLDSARVRHALNVTKLQNSLPVMNFNLAAGENNILNNLLTGMDKDFTNLSFHLSNDTLINIDGRVLSLTTGSTVIDTLNLNVRQVDDRLLLALDIANRPGTLDQWARVNLSGEIDANHAELSVNQQNIEGKTGYRLGMQAQTHGDWLAVNVIPLDPVIGYKDWNVNDSNYVAINLKEMHLDADLMMKSAESSINIFTEHKGHGDSIHQQEPVNLKIKDIKLQEWIAVNPYAPPVAGDLSADMRFGWGNHIIGGKGTASVTDLIYGKERVGSFDLDLKLGTNDQGTVRAAATLMVDSVKTITAVGNLNDSTATNPFLLDFKMIQLPLKILNPFLPPTQARLSGTLNGNMDITGSMSRPIFNGFLDFDDASILVPMLGTSYRFSDAKIPMDSNVVKINDFKVFGANSNPLVINGTVDARHLNNILINLDANAKNMQVVNSKKGKNVQVVGRAFINLAAGIRGSMSKLDVTADLSLLPPTNVTYVMGASPSTNGLSSQSTAGVVKFINFNDTVAVEAADSVTPATGMLMSVSALLRLQQGTIINIDLSSSGQDRVQLQPSGTLDYDADYMGDTHLTGRLNLDRGYVRYSPPLLSEKNFSFQPGSYVSFSGNMDNPYVNIKAIDVLKANVEQEGRDSRLINFDVILNLTNTLDNLNVAFDLSTKDDITVANELQSMSPEQRANQAMNLLLYNVYTGPGTKANSNLTSNPIYSFLESQVNSWAANNIKGVDLSFGIDQYDRTVEGASSTATSYSYKVSKSLFNDRFKISVGGNYATDDDRDQNLSQNLINDISFEYYLTPSGSMYVKIFRHTGFESILEGEVTQTGVGFVYKRKLRRLGDLFLPVSYFRRRAQKAAQEKATEAPLQTSPVTETE